jgi:hypothetical protein
MSSRAASNPAAGKNEKTSGEAVYSSTSMNRPTLKYLTFRAIRSTTRRISFDERRRYIPSSICDP